MMRYAIVINLDYDTNPPSDCHVVLDTLRERMIAKGFRLEGRLFTIELDEISACDLAREVVDNMDDAPAVNGKGMYSFLKEFYGYDHTGAVNLLLPPANNILLEEG